MPTREFTYYETQDLEKAIPLYTKLEDLGLAFIDEEGLRELKEELKRRKK